MRNPHKPTDRHGDRRNEGEALLVIIAVSLTVALGFELIGHEDLIQLNNIWSGLNWRVVYHHKYISSKQGDYDVVGNNK